MTRSMPLFLRIFLGFWLVTIVVLGSAIFAGNYLDTLVPDAGSLTHDARNPDRRAGPPRVFVRLLYELQNAPLEELPRIIRTTQNRHDVEVYLLDAAGDDILQRTVPAAAARVAAQLDRDRRRVFQRRGTQQLLGHQLYRADSGRLRSVLILSAPRIPLVNLLGDNFWLRAALATLVSGLLCYAVSRLLTRRLGAVRGAARKLAAGDLQARIAVREAGGDETDDLARDFNHMARLLEERISAQKQLLSDVSHELRSPLARLQVALGLAEQNPANATAQLPRIAREAQRLESLVAELLESQAERSDLEQHIDLVALLDELCADARFEVGDINRVRFHSAVEEALVVGNGTQLRKVFDNVLRNACSYSPAETVVDVQLRKTASRYEVVIADQGPGVPEEDLARIFEPFYRLDTARARQTGGHGLGLSIARQAVMMHGGTIDARNTRPGLAMRISLPAWAQDPA
ncbi:MAG: ATP-binding protein [Halieaceae bacterium]|uniref:ATP-binding protein n=1 Tax=Haliea alexandrii TaxID=2448162 RepID=UPI000F0B8064|nr:ATP-binding protein [Haliea alexandrii]MCR9184413.1 ATP-binding protein [Halieaceae bacterium]